MFKKIFNYIILIGLIYLVFIQNNEKFVEIKVPKKSKKKKKYENKTDVNSLIDSVMEEELFSKPITEEEAKQGMSKNESKVVSNFYKMNSKQEQQEDEEEETNIEEYIDETQEEEQVKPRQEDEEPYAETDEERQEDEEEETNIEEQQEDEEQQPRKKVDRYTKPVKCMNQNIPTFSYKKKNSKSSIDMDMNIYKPESSRIRHLQKIDKSVPRTVRNVFEEKIVDFKKGSSLGKDTKDRIQGCFITENNQTSKFSSFKADSESPYDMDINANDINFENYSLI
tara:strand:+ start:3010 stop:3855 length:846 start_codon:yes stop_codon:yes gene_type:complete